MDARREWLKVDLRCLLCHRLAGCLVRPTQDAAEGELRLPTGQWAFRSADRSLPIRLVSGAGRIRCADCGGSVMTEDVESFRLAPAAARAALHTDARPVVALSA
jgi:hypothetical protein